MAYFIIKDMKFLLLAIFSKPTPINCKPRKIKPIPNKAWERYKELSFFERKIKIEAVLIIIKELSSILKPNRKAVAQVPILLPIMIANPCLKER